MSVEIDKLKKVSLNEKNKEQYAQYYTSFTIARYMATLFKKKCKKNIRILDPGSGEGRLAIALLERLLVDNKSNIKKIEIILYEIDTEVIKYLDDNMKLVAKKYNQQGIQINYIIKNENFIETSLEDNIRYDYVIMNPPYKKLAVDSQDNKILEGKGIKVPNYYAAFISIAKRKLSNGGQIVAIIPRSFCNGLYYKSFREDILEDLAIEKIHLFESRTDIFKDDSVLQENVIIHLVKRKIVNNYQVNILHSYNALMDDISISRRNIHDVVLRDDKNKVIRIMRYGEEQEICRRIQSLKYSLDDLEIEVSTGPVVDFRENPESLLKESADETVPLLFCEHIQQMRIQWPKEDVKNYNYIKLNNETKSRLRPKGNYVLVKRMTSKEEPRRIVAALCEKESMDYSFYGFDNKLNYFHKNKEGISEKLAKGLVIYLNSTIIDIYFRTFSGSTQVNAHDLRSLKYPSKEKIIMLSKYYDTEFETIDEFETMIERVIFS